MEWYEDPIYLKQCKKAVEMQKEKISFELGDFYIAHYNESYSISHISHPKRDSTIWLPRQDQLQKMLRRNEDSRVWHPSRRR